MNDVISAQQYRELAREDDEATVFAAYLEELKRWKQIEQYTHTAQETPNENRRFRNARMGVRCGLPDYVIVTRSKVIFIELKRIKGGKVSNAQNLWMKALAGKRDVVGAICYGFEDAKRIIEANL